jgi:hypothetical protein
MYIVGRPPDLGLERGNGCNAGAPGVTETGAIFLNSPPAFVDYYSGGANAGGSGRV